jgi:excisionase family DNA binding protein
VTRLLTMRDVAGLLCVSSRTVKRLLARGELPVVRVGRLVRVREDDVRRFMANRERLCAGPGASRGVARSLGPGERLWD